MIKITQKCGLKVILFITILLSIYYVLINVNSWRVQLRVNLPVYSSSKTRIYCFIVTSPKYFNTRARAVNLTWAPRCDKFSFISEYSTNTNGLPVAPIGNISAGYTHLTQKTTLALQYIYKNFVNDFDWFVKADDDTYLFVENLKSFLKDQNSSEPITFGYDMKTNLSIAYHSGGGGYVLSREAVKRFYEGHQKRSTICSKDGGSEDVEIAKCLHGNGVYRGKSVDKYNRERFHPLSFSDHFTGRFPDWLHRLAERKLDIGLNCCSNTTISFHYVTPEQQYLIDKVRYGFHNEA